MSFRLKEIMQDCVNVASKIMNKNKVYPVSVLIHDGRKLSQNEIALVTGVQQMGLDGVSMMILKYKDNREALDLIRLAMRYHVYRNDFDLFLKTNKKQPKIKAVAEVWSK